MGTKTTLAEAEESLRDLLDDEEQIRQELSAAIEAAAPAAIIKNRRALEKNSIYQYAAEAQVLKLRRTQTDHDRQEKIKERDALEIELTAATKAYAEVVDLLAEKQLTMNQIQLRLGILDMTIESQREDRNEADRDLKVMVADWQNSNSFLRAPTEFACDLD